MADPKYAGLPGIASGQPDTFETFSDHDQDLDEESDSEQMETLHLSSLSWIGGDLEILDRAEKENLLQKYTRLRCEVNEFSEELNSLAESAQEGSLAGLHKQVIQLQQQLEGCLIEQDPSLPPPSNQQDLLENLRQQIKDITQGSGDSNAAVSGSYDLYLQVDQPNSSETIARLDQRLARLEKVIGPDPLARRKVLSVGTDSLALVDAVDTLESRRYALAADHLSHVEGRISALVSKLNALKEQKKKVSAAKNVSEVSQLFGSLESRAGIVTVLPDIIERLQDLKELHQNSSNWNSRTSEISTDQEKTETLLSENCKQIESTQKMLSDGLQGVTLKLEKLQASLLTLKA